MEFFDKINLLSPIGHWQIKTALNKIPLGGKVVIYDSGTTVLSKVYKDKQGEAVWFNPIMMDSLGHPVLEIWLQFGKLFDFMFYDGNGNLVQAFYKIEGVNDFTNGGQSHLGSKAEWIETAFIVDQGEVNGVKFFDLKGDFTDKILLFQRLRLVTDKAVFGWATNITLSSPEPSPVTHITYETDHDSPILGFINTAEYGIISSQHTSFPTYLSGAVYIKRGVDFDAGDLTEIWTEDGNLHYINGSATIEDFGSVKKTQPGATKWLIFNDPVTIQPHPLEMIKTPRNEPIEVVHNDIVQIILDDTTGITNAFPLVHNAIDLSTHQPPEKKQTILAGELGTDGLPNLIKVPIINAVVPIMGSNTTPIGFMASASSETRPAYEAFGGGGKWWTGTTDVYPAWVSILLPQAKKVRAYSFNVGGNANQCPSSFMVQGSNDGSSWTNLDIQENQSGLASETKTYYLNHEPIAYAHFRFVILSIPSGTPLLHLLQYYEFTNDADFTTDDEEVFSPVFGTEVLVPNQKVVFPEDQTSSTTPLNVTASSYFIQNPVMTSNTLPTPYVASASSQYDANYQAWEVFDFKNTDPSDRWLAPLNTITGWIQLYSASAYSVNRYGITSANQVGSEPYSIKDWTLQGSLNGTDWTILDTRTNEPIWGVNETRYFTFQNLSLFNYYRLNITLNQGGAYLDLGMLQLFRGSYTQLNPKMTSNTTPAGYIASASSSTGTHLPWKAFSYTDANEADAWLTNAVPVPGWLQIQFPSEVICNTYSLSPRNEPAEYSENPRDWTFQGSNNGTDWTILDTRVNITYSLGSINYFYFQNSVAYLYYRINVTATNNVYSYIGIGELRLYNTNLPTAPYLAFDSSPSTGWYAGLPFTIGDWLKVELLEPSYMSSYLIQSKESVDPPWGCPSTFIIEGSDDGALWDHVDTRTGVAWSGASEIKIFTLSANSNLYKYWRIVVNETSNGEPPYISNLRFTRIENSNEVISYYPAHMTSDTAPTPYVASANRSLGVQEENLLTWSENLLDPIWTYYKSHAEFVPDEVTPIGTGCYNIFCDATGTTDWNRQGMGQTYTFKAGVRYNLSAYVKFPNQPTLFADIEFPQQAMTSPTTPLPYESNASGDPASSFLAYNKIVETLNDTLVSLIDNGWVQIKLPEKININSFSITWGITNNDFVKAFAPSAFQILGSNDGTNFTIVHTVTGNPPGSIEGQPLLQTFTLPSTSASYQYWRLLVNQTAGNIGSAWCFEIRFYGFKSEDSPVDKGQLNIYTPTELVQPETGIKVFIPPNGNLNFWATSTGWNYSQKSTVYLANGWMRVNGEFWANVDTTASLVGACVSTNIVATEQGLYVTGIQLTEGADLRPYVPTTDTPVIPAIPKGDAYLAFDSDIIDTGWYAGEFHEQDDWLKIDMGKLVFITDYEISSNVNPANVTYAPKAFILEASVNDIDWTDLDYQTDLTWPDGISTMEFNLPDNETYYRYYRLLIIESTGT